MNMYGGVLVVSTLLAGCGAEGAAGNSRQLSVAFAKEFPELVESPAVKAVEDEVNRRLPELQKQFGFVSRAFVRALLTDEGFWAIAQMDAEIKEYTQKAAAYMAQAQKEMDASIDRLLSQSLADADEHSAEARAESDSDRSESALLLRVPSSGRGTCGRAAVPADNKALVQSKQNKSKKPENRL